MSKILSFLGIFTAALLIGRAAQADGHSSMPVSNWEGVYAGAHIGGGEAKYDGIFDSSEGVPIFQSFARDLDLDGVAGGVQIGYNRVRGTTVYGVEADITFTDFDDSALDRDGGPTDFIEGEVDWLATIRGRLGGIVSPAGNILVFTTGGIAFAGANYTANDGPVAAPTSSGSVDFNDIGFVGGGGVEVMRGERMSFKVEGLYYVFNDRKDASTLNADSDPGDFAKFDDFWMVRAGFNIKLGSRAAPASLK